MATETNSIVLHYDRTRFDALREAGQMWLRVSQIVTPLGFSKQHAVVQLFTRHQAEFGPDETRMTVEQTAGGPQMVRLFSPRGCILLTMLARTEPAARFRRWLLDLLEGKAPIGARPSGDLLEQVEGPPALSEHPMVRAAIHTSLQAGATVAQAFRDARQLHKQARRQAALAGLSARELRILVERERWQQMRLPGQPSLPLEG